MPILPSEVDETYARALDAYLEDDERVAIPWTIPWGLKRTAPAFGLGYDAVGRQSVRKCSYHQRFSVMIV